jgi:very-short-patch-repair endonuclease
MSNKILTFATHPKSKFWSSKNELKPENISLNSNKKFLFFCDKCNHEFLRPIKKINNKEHCTYCVIPSKLLCKNIECIFCFEKSFASNEKSKYWSNKNIKKPRDVSKSSSVKYIFDCLCGHEIEIMLSNINTGFWCGYCCKPSKKLCDDKDCNSCFEKSFASHEKSKFIVDKNFNPRNIFKNSHEKILFNCDNCYHDFECSLGNINNNRWCPYCCIPSRLLCSEHDCTYCFEKSFASHEKSKYWSIKNINLPRQLSKSSNTKYIFNCQCNHEIEIALNSVAADSWCSYCCKPQQKLCNNKECIPCFENSFANHKKLKFWSEKNIEKPRYVIKLSRTKYIFYCDICSHEFERRLCNVKEDSTHCIYCVIPTKLLCYDDNCIFCYNRSFASFGKSKYWSKKNKSNPRELIKSTNNKFIFDCDKCGCEFDSALSNVIQNKWCPYCVNKTEQKLYDNLQLIYPELQQQYKIEWCKNKTYLPFDFVLESCKIIIELDGIQHFKQVSNWTSPEKTQENDKYKMKCANNNNFSIIRILQEDVFYDIFDWLNELKVNIEKIKNENKIQNIFICKDNEYDMFI